MEENKQKMSYEDLEKAANGLLEKCNNMSVELQKANAFAASISRLDLLFRVMDNSKEYSPEFITYVTTEIEKALTLKKEDTEEAKEEE